MTSPVPDAAAPTGGPARATPLAMLRDVAITHDGQETARPASVSFSVSPGEVVLLLGPSGSGKSTLTLALNGLLPQSIPAEVEGDILIAGQDATSTPVSTLSTTVGMVFQDPDAQLVTGTLLDEVAFGPENLRLPVDEVLRRAEDSLRRVGLWERRGENPDRLSGGGRQRLAIACALAMGSPLLVLDEPTANLDPAGIEEVYATLAEVIAAGDRAILLVEHNLDAAIEVTTRVVALDHEGRTVMDGPTSMLRDRAEELHSLGVWLPVATLAALRLRTAGWTLDPLPLTPDQLATAVDREDGPGAAGSVVAVTRGSVADGSVGPVAGPGATSTGTRPALLEARGLTVTRGRTEILHGVDLQVQDGEFVAIVGANGAGKTTLLQALAGVIPIPRGQVHIEGDDLSRVSRRDVARRIGFVFQNPEHQFIAHTVFDEIAHGLRRQKLPTEEVDRVTDDVLARFGLTAARDRHPFLLSGGQKRRLSVGTALVAGAPLLALDEPTFGQDRARADELLHLLRDLRAQGTTILVVTHDMQLVTDYADRTVVVGDGRLLADAPTREVFADEALLRSAGLRLPPLRRALQGSRHAELAGATRLSDLPGSDG